MSSLRGTRGRAPTQRRGVPRVKVADPAAQRALDSIPAAMQPALTSLIVGGKRLAAVTITTTPQPIAHGLGHTPVGVLVISSKAPIVVQVTASDEKTITLWMTYLGGGPITSVVADLWVF
jgi:hypothetical protein